MNNKGGDIIVMCIFVILLTLMILGCLVGIIKSLT